MSKKISTNTKKELLEALRCRYQESTKKEKVRILDEFVEVSGYHRKHAIRLFSKRYTWNKTEQSDIPLTIQHGRRIYDEAVKEALIVTWEAADRICGKRLKAILPDLVNAMERHGHLNLEAELRRRLLSASAATIDRLLSPIRNHNRSRKKKRRTPKLKKKIPIRTSSDWNDPNPGYFEIDLVVHSGGSMADSFIHTLAVTDICTEWTECIPLLAREQSLVVEGLDVLFQQIPIPVKGIDSDNDSAFINETLLDFCKKKNIEFTRSRAYRKNDQAWIEQKNGAVVRKMVGYERYSGIVAGQSLAQLYQIVRLYINYFQPSFKLQKKKRIGAKVRKIYDLPTTPCDRLLNHPEVNEDTKEMLRAQRQQLDPVELLHQIREGQAVLAALVSEDGFVDGPAKKTLDQFLSQLPKLWKSGEARPTHRTKTVKPRDWRTRKDPFENVWLDVLGWLQRDPDATAKELFIRLQKEHPGRFPDCQIRTLQRRVREWRHVMAKKLVYACIEGDSEANGTKSCGFDGKPRK